MAAELVLAPVIEKGIEKIIDACYEYLKGQVRWQRGLKKELQKLRHIQPHIKAVMSAYRQVEIQDLDLNKWYWQLRDAIDEADDVLDEIEYRELQKQANKNNKTGKVRFLMKSINKRFVLIGKRALKIDSNLKSLEAAVQKLNKISAEVSIFRDLLKEENQKQEQQQLQLLRIRETGSILGNEFFGRSEEITVIKDWLRNQYETQSTETTDLYRNISLLSVVGAGGMGKTTLLQRVYEDVLLNKDGSSEGFDVKIWACVSTNSDAATVIKNILESLKKESSNLISLDSLQEALNSELMSKSQSENKRFLLVLDDIWEESETYWRQVFAPLKIGSLGSKILITTRMNSVADMFAKIIKQGNVRLPLRGMKRKELLKLFNTHAFAGVGNRYDEFKDIAEMMVEKLLGCPLAAKLAGNTLNSQMDMSFWRNVLDTNLRNIQSIKSGQNDLLPILKLSYIHLPNHLQTCFSFCSIFPKGYVFDKDDLVRMWIALDYIQSSKFSRETLEDTGRRYFDFLVQSSIFDIDEFDRNDNKVYYKMHDLLHELAESISAQESFSVVGDEDLTNLPKTIRHLSIDTNRPKEAIKQMDKFKNLRSLFLSFKTSDNLTDVFSEDFKASKSIRLMVISAPCVREIEIPERIGCLIHLRYLKIKCQSGDAKLLRSLSNLHHLHFIFSKKLQDLKMAGQQELKTNENCQLIIDELVIKNSSVLHLGSIGSLRILRVKKNDELFSFPSETEQWFLQPHSSLLELEFCKLQSLQSLPSSFESLSSLKTLHVSNVPQLKLLPNPAASLVRLELHHLKSLQCLPPSLSTISSLKTLKLVNIPLLKSLPGLPSYLWWLFLMELENLDCLPSSLPTTLRGLSIIEVPRPLELPVLPDSLSVLSIHCCHLQLMERHPNFDRRH